MYMGNRNQKMKKNLNQKHEREFEDMKKRIMTDNSRVRENYPKNNYQRRYHEDHENNVPEEVTGPESRVSDFLLLIDQIVEKYNGMYEQPSADIIKVFKGTRKQDNGIVFVKLTINREDSENPHVLLIYYMEDHNVNPKKRNVIKEYQCNILIVNQSTGNVLFNRFGYGLNCIEKAKNYIDTIVSKTVGVNPNDTTTLPDAPVEAE